MLDRESAAAAKGKERKQRKMRNPADKKKTINES